MSVLLIWLRCRLICGLMKFDCSVVVILCVIGCVKNGIGVCVICSVMSLSSSGGIVDFFV